MPCAAFDSKGCLFLADFVAKLDEEQLARNIRIEAREFLNQHCALALGLESILRAGPLKIVLHKIGIREA